MRLSSRVESIKTSPVRKLLPYAENAEKNGKIVHYLNIGQPDIETPIEFFKAISEYKPKVLKYSQSKGEKELILQMIEYYKQRSIQLSYDDILITNGGSEALLFVLSTICDCGDEILIPEPYYANYNSFFDLLQIKVRPIITKAQNGYHLDCSMNLKNLINERTKAILVCNPGNPTGTVYTKSEMDYIKKIALDNNLFIISDEVYREFCYEDNEVISFISYEDLYENVVLIDSISKRYSVCGARIGAVISKNKRLMNNIYKLCQMRLAAPTIEMIGAVELYKIDESFIKNTISKYKKRRDYIYNSLNSIPGVTCKKPEGAFYIMAKLPVENAEDFIIWLLEKFEVENETLMMAPGEGFYSEKGLGKDEVRICYALDERVLEKAIKILKLGLEKYNS